MTAAMFDNDYNMQGTVLFRFLGCEGLGLQQSDSLSKITTDVFQDRFAPTTLYLLDTKGNIRCSVLADKSRYEDYDNQDRRQSNMANGFNVLWDQDGRSCTVYYRPAPKSNMKLVAVAALVALVVGALGAWFATWMVMDSSIDEARREERERARIAYEARQAAPEAATPAERQSTAAMSASKEAEQAISEAHKAVDAAVNEANDAVTDAGRRVDLRIEARTMQSRLQRENCTMKTVDNVNTWFRRMSPADRRIVCESYPFEKAIEAYKIFFSAKDRDEMKKLIYDADKYFSAKQKTVVRWYARDSKKFRQCKNDYGLRFDIPEKVF